MTHQFAVARLHTVTLTVTDAGGTAAAKSDAVTVTAVAAPTSPVAGQQVTLTATATAATGHSIQSYAWSFGDGTTQTTTIPTVTKTYNTPGTYGVTVVATDDLAQTGTGTASVTIAAAITFASTAFTFSPTAPVVDEEVIFTVNTITTSNGATINTYTWDVGDRSDLVSTSSSRVTHTFGRARTSFVVRLSVEDSLGRTATVTRDVTVAP